MKYLTLGLAAAVLTLSVVSASPTDAHIDELAYLDQIEARAGPPPPPKAKGGTDGGNGTAETAQEKAEDDAWKAFDKAFDQNDCAHNNPHGFDQKRLSKICSARSGTLATAPVDNKTPITYLGMAEPSAKPKPSTLAPGKASLYVCNCKVSFS